MYIAKYGQILIKLGTKDLLVIGKIKGRVTQK